MRNEEIEEKIIQYNENDEPLQAYKLIIYVIREVRDLLDILAYQLERMIIK